MKHLQDNPTLDHCPAQTREKRAFLAVNQRHHTTNILELM